MRIASWNVNSIRARLPHLIDWLSSAHPDVVCIQETKVEDALFPEEALADEGYRSVFFGQKSYNGMAILARMQLSIDDVVKNLEGDDDESQKRLLACTIDGVRIVNVYVPNGQTVSSPAFAFKLEWLARLRSHLEKESDPKQPLLLCGDFNIAPEPIDVHYPKRWEGKVLFHPDERTALARLIDWGLVDSFRRHHPDEAEAFTWWDYRTGAYKRNRGLRIDHILLTESLAARSKDVTIDHAPRKLEKPSDHAPIVVELED